MFRASLFLLICTIVSSAYGMDCSYGQEKNYISKFLNSCPEPFSDSSKSYCCLDTSKQEMYCCNAAEYAVNTGIVIISIGVGAVLVIIFCIGCCCCCSRCCPLYRRR